MQYVLFIGKQYLSEVDFKVDISINHCLMILGKEQPSNVIIPQPQIGTQEYENIQREYSYILQNSAVLNLLRVCLTKLQKNWAICFAQGKGA